MKDDGAIEQERAYVEEVEDKDFQVLEQNRTGLSRSRALHATHDKQIVVLDPARAHYSLLALDEQP